MSESKYLKNIACPRCEHTDSLGVYERDDGSIYGKCFHIDCEEERIIDNPENIEEPSKKIKMTYPPISRAGYHPLLTRGISKETCEKYGVLSTINENGVDEYHYYQHTNEGKVSCHAIRQVSPKDFSWMGSPKSIEFFGQSIAGDGGKMILVTEGACDAMAVSEMLAKCGKNYRCISITSGSSSSINDFKNNYEWISKFENIFLALDQDDAGQKAVAKIANLFPPNKVKNLKFSEKDPNDMLLANKHNEFLQSIFSAKESKPDGIVGVDELYDEAITPPVQGFSFPWSSLTEVTYGYRFGELWGIGAGSGTGKSLLKGTKVRLHNGSVKKVEDITIGDKLLSDTGDPNTVLFLGDGIDEIYKVEQSDGTEYFCNSTHILSLVDSNGIKINKPITFVKSMKDKVYGYNGIADYKERNTFIPPYILGIWLGDGHNHEPSITCGDEEVLKEWSDFGESIGLVPTEYFEKGNCRRINLSRKIGTSQNNILKDILSQYNLPLNKHIPDDYLINSRENRLQLLAGLLDTDGYLNPSTMSRYEIISKYEQLGKDIESLARSLGFRVKKGIKIVNDISYQRLSISGDLSTIPCRVPRKNNGRYSIVDNNPKILSNYSRIVSIEKVGIGEYYGFGLSNNKLFCLENYTVTHNTEFFKECIHHTINTHNRKVGVIFLEEPAAKTLKVLAGKKVNKRFHIPSDKGGDWTIEELIDGINDLKGKVYLYNHFGAKDWESIKPKIRYMVSALGIKEIYLDHLTALVAQEDNEYKALNKLMEEMSSLCQELDCVIFYVSHLRKASGTPHEEGGRVTADQFKGSGAIVFWSNFLIGLERDQQAEDEEERNITTLRVLKDRNTGLATGHTFKLKYNHNTGRWGELDEDEFNEEFN